MEQDQLKQAWLHEEEIAHIIGWDFSHIKGRYMEEEDLPWDYGQIVRGCLTDGKRLLDFDTGGGEFLLSLGHPAAMTAATEGYPPNVALCRERLLPLGIDFRSCADPAGIPFPDAYFDIIINRHGDFVPQEIKRLLKPGGVFITQQVGRDNDRDLVRLVLPDAIMPFPQQTMEHQRRAFDQEGFRILRAEEAYRPIHFYDIGAFVWFARIIEWEFSGFSVEKCWERLLDMQRTVEREGKISGTIHRFLIAAQK